MKPVFLPARPAEDTIMTILSLRQAFRGFSTHKPALKPSTQTRVLARSGQTACERLQRLVDNMLRRSLRAASVALITLVPVTSAWSGDLRLIYELAIENDPQIGAAKANYMARREVITQARAQLLPFAQLSGSTTHGRR